MEKSVASSTSVEVQIVHAVKGRVRLRLKSDDARELLPKVVHYLGQQAGILKVQIKQNNSLVVTFDPDVMSIEQLTDSLQSVGLIARARETVPQSTDQSQAIAYSRLLTVIPPVVGLVIARSLQVSGWKSILAYILAAGVTREVIDQVTGESEAESEKVELSSAKKISTTEVGAEEISTLLTAIKTDYEIVHQIPGRMRLRIPRISRDCNYARELKQSLEQDKRITDIRLKINSSSVVILYDSEALAESHKEKAALNNRNGNKIIQTVDESESSTMPDQKTNNQKPAPESEPNDTPTSDDETDDGTSSESISLTSETETRDTVETEEESTTPIAHEESEIEANQELTQQEIVTNANYWSNFKSSMLLAMLEMMGNLQVQTAEI